MPNDACHLVDANFAFTYCLSSCWSLFFNVVAANDAVYAVAFADGIYDLVMIVMTKQLFEFTETCFYNPFLRCCAMDPGTQGEA